MSIGKVINAGSFPELKSIVSGEGMLGKSEKTKAPNALDSFGELMTEGVGKVNQALTDYEKISKQFAQGEKVNVHEMMIKGEQADMGLRLMMSLRNKVLEAYQEVMRMSV